MSDPAIHYARKWQFASTAQTALGLAMVGATLFASRHNEQIDLLRFPLAWSGVLMLLDGLVRLRHGRSPLATPADWAWSLAASIAFWDVFELVNLRLHNWWYTAVPRTLLGDVAFSAVSFATVLPAVQLGDALLRPRNESRPLPVGRSGPAGDGLLGSAAFLVALGVASLALPLAFPRACFGLAWLFVFPLAEAALLLAGPRPLHALASPLEAWRSGDRTLAYRLLAFGIPLGFVWEGLNWGAERGWVYTVPGFESHKLFEMPLLGFTGYPVFLLEAGAVLALVARIRSRVVGLWPVALAVGLVGFHIGCDWEARTHAAISTAPVLGDVEEFRSITPALEQTLGVRTPRELLEASRQRPDFHGLAVSAHLGDTQEPLLAVALRECALADRTGMGLKWAAAMQSVGVDSIDALAGMDAETLFERIEQLPGRSSTSAPDLMLMRLWISKARR